MNQESKPNLDQQSSQTKQVLKTAFMGLRTGCLTFFLAGAALGVGILLDTRLGTYPRWTLILLGISAPIALGGVYWIVRRSLDRSKEKDRGEVDNESES